MNHILIFSTRRNDLVTKYKQVYTISQSFEYDNHSILYRNLLSSTFDLVYTAMCHHKHSLHRLQPKIMEKNTFPIQNLYMKIINSSNKIS